MWIQSLSVGMQIARERGMSGSSMANASITGEQDRANSEIKLRGPQRRSDLLCRIIEGETVILNRKTGVLHRLNPTASFIWECCDGTLGVDDIIARLASAYDVDLMIGQKDVSETLLKFESLNLLMR
jgi:Coenzyme PQQ synthesis protein D (PqqD)